MTDFIFHITSRISWNAAQKAGTYIADSLATSGFIHCSHAGQVPRVASSFYAGQHGLVLLVIDPLLLTTEIRWEPGTDKADELFPHVFGPINLEAVVRVLDFEPDTNGKFRRVSL